MVGVVYWRQEYDQAGALSLSGAIFWVVMNQSFSAYASMLNVSNLTKILFGAAKLDLNLIR